MSSNNKKVSVIIPIYKVEKYLGRCVDSVLHQTYENLEIILVDDGSPDSCPQMCDSYKERDRRIQVVHKKNGGLSSARNAGMKVCAGEYIFFVDSDDWIDKDTIEDLVGIAERESVDFVRTRGKHAGWPNHEDGTVCDFGIESMMVEGKYPRSKIEDEILPICIATKQITFGPIVSAWGNLYRTDFLRREQIMFSEDIKYSEDGIFNARVLMKANSFYYINSRQYYNYFFNQTSITKSFRSDRWESNISQMKHFWEDFGNQKQYEVQEQLWRKNMFCILNALNERYNIADIKERKAYCKKICHEKITKQTMQHLKLVSVPWKLYLILLMIKYEQVWLLARI